MSSLSPASTLPAPTGRLVVGPAPEDTDIILSLVIPTYNEAENIRPLVERLDELFRPQLGNRFELLIVDDDSPDETWKLAAELAVEVPSLRVIRRQGEKGLSTAVIRGWQASRGEVIGVMDADLQHPPEVNLKLLRKMKRGADIAVASRNVAGGGVSSWSMIRRILSRGAQLLGLLFLPEVFGRLSDPMSGYFMLRRSAIVNVPLDPVGYKILIEVMTRGETGWLAEVPYVFRERIEGDSKVTWKQYRDYIRHLLRLRFSTASGSPFFRYAFVGLSGVAIDMSLLYIFSDQDMLGWGIARSKALAAQPALLWNFLFHESWAFSGVEKPKEMRQVIRRFLAYYAVGTVGLFFTLVILSALVEFAALSQYLANALAISIVASWNYWLHRRITWAEATVVDETELPAEPFDVSAAGPFLPLEEEAPPPSKSSNPAP